MKSPLPATALSLAFLSFLIGAAASPAFGAETTVPRPAASGFRLDLSGGGGYSPSYGEGEAPLAAYGCALSLGAECLRGAWIPIRSALGLFSIEDSEWNAELFRYRGYWGLRWSAEAGYRFRFEALELDLLAGGALSSVRYTDVSAVTAYPSILAEARLSMPLALGGLRGLSVCAALPLEYQWRGTARTISACAELGVSFALPSKATTRTAK